MAMIYSHIPIPTVCVFFELQYDNGNKWRDWVTLQSVVEYLL
jgi:hypothetical protein